MAMKKVKKVRPITKRKRNLSGVINFLGGELIFDPTPCPDVGLFALSFGYCFNTIY